MPGGSDVARELELLWIALDDERLVVQMKNDVISSLQHTLRMAEAKVKDLELQVDVLRSSVVEHEMKDMESASAVRGEGARGRPGDAASAANSKVSGGGSGGGDGPFRATGAFGSHSSSSLPPPSDDDDERGEGARGGGPFVHAGGSPGSGLPHEHQNTDDIAALQALEDAYRRAVAECSQLKKGRHRVTVSAFAQLEALESRQRDSIAEMALVLLDSVKVQHQLAKEVVHLGQLVKRYVDEAADSRLTWTAERKVLVANSHSQRVSAEWLARFAARRSPEEESVDSSSMGGVASPDVLWCGIAKTAFDELTGVKGALGAARQVAALQRETSVASVARAALVTSDLGTFAAGALRWVVAEAREALALHHLIVSEEFVASSEASKRRVQTSRWMKDVAAWADRSVEAATAHLETMHSDIMACVTASVPHVVETRHAAVVADTRSIIEGYESRIVQLEERGAQKTKVISYQAKRIEELDAQSSTLRTELQQLQLVRAAASPAGQDVGAPPLPWGPYGGRNTPGHDVPALSSGPQLYHHPGNHRPGPLGLPPKGFTPPAALAAVGSVAASPPPAPLPQPSLEDPVAAGSPSASVSMATLMSLADVMLTQHGGMQQTLLSFFRDSMAAAMRATSIAEAATSGVSDQLSPRDNSARQLRVRSASQHTSLRRALFNWRPSNESIGIGSVDDDSTAMEAASDDGGGFGATAKMLLSSVDFDGSSAAPRQAPTWEEMADARRHSASTRMVAHVARTLMEAKAQFGGLLLYNAQTLFEAWMKFTPIATVDAIRIQVAESSLALVEAQRDQATSTAQWMLTQCTGAVRALSSLISKVDSVTSGDAAMHLGQQGSSNGGSDGHRTALDVGDGEGGSSEGSVAVVSKQSLEFASLCDRMLDRARSLHSDLLDRESKLMDAGGAIRASDAAASEFRAAADITAVSSFVEREINDDALVTLREHMRLERQCGLQCMQQLFLACGQRNVAIRDLQSSLRDAMASAHAGALIARHEQEAVDLLVGLLFVAWRQHFDTVWAVTLPSPNEVAFTMLVVHMELVLAMESLHDDTIDQLIRLRRQAESLVHETLAARTELIHVGREMVVVTSERRREKAVSDLFDGFYSSLLDVLAQSVRDMQANVFHDLFCDWKAAIDAQLRATHFAQIANSERDDAVHQRLQTSQALEDQGLTISVLAEQNKDLSTAIQAAASEMAALRESQSGDRSAALRLDAETKRLDEQLATVSQLLAAEQQAAEIARSHETALERDLTEAAGKIAQLNTSVATLQQAVDRERDAHRQTIKTMAAKHAVS